MRWGCALWLVTGCGFTVPPSSSGAPDVALDATPADATPDAPPPAFHLQIRADIDGRSQLVFHGTSVHWHHFQFAAPGREQGDELPTGLGAYDWFPDWPDQPTAENRDCGCLSSSYDGLAIGIPRAAGTVTITPVSGRRDPTVVQEPAAANDYTLIVETSDLGFSGSATYVFDVDVVP